jgi:hypothetical protein
MAGIGAVPKITMAAETPATGTDLRSYKVEWDDVAPEGLAGTLVDRRRSNAS